jgi:hypothetical protein
MRADARVALPERDPCVATSGSLFDAETQPARSGSYELQPLSDKAAPARFSPHDDSIPPQQPDFLTETDDPAMSRTPLLMRSSPAQGTGSYGGLPLLSVSSSPDESDHHVTNFLQRGKKKGKSKLRNSEPSMRRTYIESSNGGSTRSAPAFTTSARRRTRRDTNSDEPLEEALAGPEESLLEARFNTGGMAASGIAAPRVFESLQSSSSGSPMDGSEEDESSDDSDDLHDSKADGHVSDNSPYAQVRAAVGASDDFTLSINTPRMWILSILFSILGSSTNLFFSLRYPSVSITPIIALLLVHPLGLLWDQVLKRSDDPEELFESGVPVSRGDSRSESRQSSHVLRSSLPWKTQCRLWLAQGRWNLKEHCCVYISSNVSFGFAFATDVSIHVQQKSNQYTTLIWP